MIHCRIPGKDLRNLLMRFLNILCKYICKGLDLHNYFKMTQLISLWVQTDIRPFISFISMTACKLCLVLWMDPLPQSLPLNIPQFWSRFLLTGSGLESTASITLLHTVSRITAVVNIYWVLTILVRLEPLSPFYKWTQEPSPHNHPKVPKEFFHEAWQHPLTTGPNQDLSHMCYIFIARNTDNCIFITITSCGKLSHSSLKLIKRTSFPNMEFFSSDQSTFLLNNQMKKYIYVWSRKQGCPFAHDPKRTLV